MSLKNVRPAFGLAGDCAARLVDLAQFPDLPPATIMRYAQILGHAGERLVDSLLLRRGEQVFEGGDGDPFDRVVYRSRALIRLQIKTCLSPRNRGYNFRIQKGFRRSGVGTRPYIVGDFHVLALVCLNEGAVFFTSSQQLSHRVPISRIPELRAHPFQSWHAALRTLGISDLPDSDAEPPLPD